MTEEVLQCAHDDAALEAKQTEYIGLVLQTVVEAQRTLGRSIMANVDLELEYRYRPVPLMRAIHT